MLYFVPWCWCCSHHWHHQQYYNLLLLQMRRYYTVESLHCVIVRNWRKWIMVIFCSLHQPAIEPTNNQPNEEMNQPSGDRVHNEEENEQKHTMLNIPEVEHHRVKHSWLNGGAGLCKWIHANEMVIVPNLKLKRCLISNLCQPSFVGRTSEMMRFEWIFHATGYRSAYIVSGLTEWENNYRVCEACSPQTKPVMIEKNRLN